MSLFEGIIEVDGELLFFSFIQLNCANELIVTVSRHRSYVVFDMKKDSFDRWKAIDPAPQWVKVQKELSEIIRMIWLTIE